MAEPVSPLALEVVITEWPTDGPARIITRPWVRPYNVGRYQRTPWDYPLIERQWDPIHVELIDLVPADPGWLAGSIRLNAADGHPICTERPVRFYGRRSDTPTHVYVPSNGHDPAYSLALRVVGGGITDD